MYLLYGWSVLSTDRNISDHYQSVNSDGENQRYSQFYSVSISAGSELKSMLFLFLLYFMLKTTTPPVYSGSSKLITGTQNLLSVKE